MRSRVLASIFVAVFALPLLAAGQERSPADLEQQMKRMRPVVLPRPSTDTLNRDVDRATEEVTEPGRTDRMIREGRERPLSRPELDYSITNGIQSQNVDRALRR